MPIIKPEIQKVLRETGILETKEELSIEQSLTQAGLDATSIADELTGLALRSSNEALRLRALETVLKVKGALKDQPTQVPSFTIVIQNSETDLSKTAGINPTLFPRQSLKSLDSLESEEERIN